MTKASERQTAEDARRKAFEIRAQIEKIRRTIAASEAMAEQVERRIRETDELLASQGLTREQVLAFRFTDEQRDLVNAELRRRGLPALEAEPGADAPAVAENAPEGGGDALEARTGKLRMMARSIRIS